MIGTFLPLLFWVVPVTQPAENFQFQVRDPNGRGVPSADVTANSRALGQTGPHGEIAFPREPLSVQIDPPVGLGLQSLTVPVTRDTRTVTLPWQGSTTTSFQRCYCVIYCFAYCDPCTCCCCCDPCCGVATPTEKSAAWNSAHVNGGTAAITLSVPEDAVVFINDYRTTKTGTRREYISRDLKPGNIYSYTVRAEIMRDGKVIAGTQELVLYAGDNKSLTLDLSGKAKTQVATMR